MAKKKTPRRPKRKDRAMRKYPTRKPAKAKVASIPIAPVINLGRVEAVLKIGEFIELDPKIITPDEHMTVFGRIRDWRDRIINRVNRR